MHQRKYLKNYKKTAYRTESINLEVDIFDEHTLIKNTSLFIKQNHDLKKIELDGVELELISLKLNGEEFKNYQIDDKGLSFIYHEDKFTLECVTKIYPKKNTDLEGFYQSGNMLCTQCEAQGFRRITYSIDRPDNMSKYQVKLIAEKSKYPTLLANGNKTSEGIDGSRHWAIWEDPHYKPSYIFAMVAGNLSKKSDQFITKSSRKVDLEIFVEEKDLDKCSYALESLKRSMKWDEDTYSLEYDLDIFMIVAVDSFNMGAMENKGLNIFNSSCVLANPQSANDHDFFSILAIVGHEYFHNWTGNRVTCRDWFQLTLKEGLTVYRDQEFTADLFSRNYQRISDVSALKLHQFAEDASALAHPIRPESYIEINNFYTSTVYEKGAEVIRMIANFLGKENYFKGIKKYFELYDGKAVTTEDFLHALEEGSGVKLDQFRTWYSQAGTPRVELKSGWSNGSLKINLKQVLNKEVNIGIELQPQSIPISMSILSDLEPVYHEDVLDNWEKEITLENIAENHTICFNRDFVAPIRVDINLSNDELLEILIKENDGYSCWHAMRKLWINGVISGNFKFIKKAINQILKTSNKDLLLKSSLLNCPSELEINSELDVFEIEKVHTNYKKVHEEIVIEFKKEIETHFNLARPSIPYEFNPIDMAKRSWRYALLKILAYSNNEEIIKSHYSNADNMTEKEQALGIALRMDLKISNYLDDDFYNNWKSDNLVINKWISLKAASVRIDSFLNDLKKITNNEVYNKLEPNKVRHLISGLVRSNFYTFHHLSFKGYDYLIDLISSVDEYNKQLASGLVRLFNNIEKYDDQRKSYLKVKLSELLNKKGLSSDTYERIKALAG